MKRRTQFANLEIRLHKREAKGYPVELTLNGGQQFQGGYLTPDQLPWVPSASPKQNGERLFNWLFTDRQLREQWGQIRGQHAKRRIRLRITADAPELHAIPWELLRDPAPSRTPQTLAAEAETPFSRYIAGEWPTPAPVAARPLKLLAAIANPDNLDAYGLNELNVEQERASLQTALVDLDPDQLDVTFLPPPVTLPALAEALNSGPHLLHIVAHGAFSHKQGSASLYLADAANEVSLIKDHELAEMLQRQGRLPHLIFLASCYGAARSPADAFRGLGPTLVRAGLPAVLAMQEAVPVETARTFSRIFYRRLLGHGQVDLASNEARATLLTADLPGSSIPVLFSRLPENQLFLRPEEVPGEEAKRVTIGQQIINFFTGTPDRQRELRDRQIMLQRVYDFWVKGVLENSLHNEMLIELGMEEKHEAVEYPWEMVLQRPDRPNRTLSPGTKIIDVFDESGGSLLILGEPGSGKTTMLLELARQTIERAQANPTQPMPVVFNLSSWAEKQLPLAEWLVEELNSKYNIPKKSAQQWIEGEKLRFLLDGLDEVAQQHQTACVEAINTFRREHLIPLVVCSRAMDYEELPTKLRLQQAIQLQPLTPQQVAAYLNEFGIELSMLKSAFQRDFTLRQLAQSPLMLSIMTLAYQDMGTEDLTYLASIRVEWEYLFAVYVKQMFERRGSSQLYSLEQTNRWLGWLAKKLLQHSEAEFLIEQLQPSWLPNDMQCWIYIFSSRLISGLIFVLPFFLERLVRKPINPPILVSTLLSGMIAGAAMGLIDGLNFGQRNQQDTKLAALHKSHFWHLGISILVGGVIFGVIFAIPFGMSIGIVIGLPFGLALGLIFGLRGVTRTTAKDVQTVERLNWVWIHGIKWATGGLIGGLIFGLSIGLIFGLIFGLNEGLRIGLIFGMVEGLFGGVVGATFGGLRGTIVETKSVPNQGIRMSARNAVLGGIIGGLSGGLIGGVIGKTTVGLIFGLNGGAMAALWYGGLDLIQHYTLRTILWSDGHIPWNYSRFLDFATERIFLRKVGGGYIFVHRYLMEYFASLEAEE